jgi:SPP1 gp7 family putative phage head morphogenesis protein
VAQFKEWWDSMLAGNTGNRRGTMFVPDGATPQDTKEKALKDEYDEWLARVICFAFSISPTPFVKQQNRATADNATSQALTEGLAPIQQWVKGLLDYIIAKHFKAPDLEFQWKEEEAIDPLEAAQISQIYVAAKVLHPDEVRADLGREPMTEEQKADLNPPTPGYDENGAPLAPAEPQNDKQDEGKPPKPDAAEKLHKHKKKVPTIDRSRPAIGKAQTAFKDACNEVFPKVAKSVAKQIVEAMSKVDASEIDRILNSIDLEGLIVLADDFEEIYEELVKDGAREALAQLGVGDDIEALTKQVNERAVEWAKDRAAEMVGKRRLPNGELIDNPNASWVIEDSTREMLRSDVARAIEEGWSNDKLAGQIADSYAFSDERAMMIARTETAFADVAGNMIAYKESGLVDKKQWLAAADCCDECQDLNGEVVGIDEPFSDGSDAPPAHPNCRCDFLPIQTDEQSTDQTGD